MFRTLGPSSAVHTVKNYVNNKATSVFHSINRNVVMSIYSALVCQVISGPTLWNCWRHVGEGEFIARWLSPKENQLVHQSSDGLAFNGMGFQLTVREPSAWKIAVYLTLHYLNQI